MPCLLTEAAVKRDQGGSQGSRKSYQIVKSDGIPALIAGVPFRIKKSVCSEFTKTVALYL